MLNNVTIINAIIFPLARLWRLSGQFMVYLWKIWMGMFFYFKISLSLAAWTWTGPSFIFVETSICRWKLNFPRLYSFVLKWFVFMNKHFPVSNLIKSKKKKKITNNISFRFRLWKVVKWYVPCHSASRRGRVNMASEQVRYLLYLLFFFHFTPFYCHAFVNSATICNL